MIILIIIGIYYYIKNYDPKYNIENYKCNLDDLDIDETYILERKYEYEKLIDKLIDEKKFIYSKKEQDVLKNKTQFYNIKDNNIKNISNDFYISCKNELDEKPIFDNNDLKLESDLQYLNIIDEFKKKIETTFPPNCLNTDVLNDKKYLKNYYYDLHGDKIESNLKDYFANYYTTINDDFESKCVPVKTLNGPSDFIIPDQFNIQKYLTNAYNIDWERIINPNTWY